MTNQNKSEDRDEVLFAFHREVKNPTAEQIIDWATRFPQFADDIRAHAAFLKDWASGEECLPIVEPDESMLLRGRSRALDALYNAKHAVAAEQSPAASHSFDQMMNMCGTDVPKLARDLDVARTVLAALVGGRMRSPVGPRLVMAIMGALCITREAFDAALRLAFATPRIGHAKAGGTPTIVPQTYEELIRASNMTDERKQYWLSED
jgi:hypothetical protein